MKYLRIDGSNNNLNFTPYDTDQEEKKSKRVKFRKISGILGISVILIIGGVICIKSYNSDPNTNEEIYKKYFSIYEVGSLKNSDYITAMENYRVGNYKKVVKLFNEIAKNETLPDPYRFYLSLSYSQLCMNNEAIEILKEISLAKNEYYYASNWYLGLSYLRGFHYEKAQIQLEKIIKEEQNPYREDALQVIRLLKKLNE